MSNYTTPFWETLKDHKIFCAFDATKNPYGIDSKRGIGADAPESRLGTYNSVKSLQYPFTGISLTRPIEIDGKYLVCIDLDWKRSSNRQPHQEQLDLIYYLQGMGAAYETSLSGHGAHIWVLSDKDKIPEGKKLPDHCEIEIFSGFKGQISNVLLTDYDFDGSLISVDLTYKLPKKQQQKELNNTITPQGSGITDRELLDPLFCIPPEDYDTWLQVGMILKYELGEAGYDLWVQWSSQSAKYDPFVFGPKWDSFKGDGLKAGTLIAKAIEYGYSKPKATALEDFGLIDLDTGEIKPTLPKSYLNGMEIALESELKPVNWVIDGVIPEGVGVIAGSAGVGKTTAIIPLALVAAGFASHMDNVKSSIHRHVVIFTEDGGQLQRILYGIRQHLKRQDNLEVSLESISKMVHLYQSKRVNPTEMRGKIREAIDLYTDIHPIIGKVPPLLIFDTASANIDLTDENSNSQVSHSMAALKEVYEQTAAPLWVIAHLTKTAKGQNVDELANLSARGGGAWEADANWTAVLGRLSEDNNISILKIDKERVGNLKGKELNFSLTMQDKWIVDQLGNDVVQQYPVVGIYQQETSQRKKEEKNKKFIAIGDAIMRAIDVVVYPSGRDLYDVVKGNRGDFDYVLNGFIRDQKLITMALPDDMKHGKKQTYLMKPPK